MQWYADYIGDLRKRGGEGGEDNIRHPDGQSSKHLKIKISLSSHKNMVDG
ncbi:hypothetical protein NUKP84_53660 [Klebsiella variicola]|nr:hypothetical protein NUKP84_53660 [Klebsiella variicola]